MWRIGAALGITGAASANYLLHKNENTGRYQLLIIPEFILDMLCKVAKAQLEKNQAIIEHDKKVYQCISEISSTITQHIDSKKTWNLTVIDSKVVNACALSDGSIYVYTGLVDLVEEPEELAFIMCHELSHVILNHTAEKVSVRIFVYLLWQLVIFYFIGGDLDLSFIKDLLVNLPLSRAAETEADIQGLKLMYKAGFGVQGAVEMMKKFKELDMEGSSALLATHPLSKDRSEVLKSEIKKIGENSSKVVENLKIRKLFKDAKSEIKENKESKEEILQTSPA
ncbi:hypothetical protein SteCoe_22652 [Stentor coeruleus]|uniref:Peptidase M48 domain-containing protein n=1 Tax=Stentor coeruleus TaxID=5963 RepID=A0A1R2BLU8_9CILI|nr:hypothetical protein SteCoe_22652 [Stentor coeruleus]